MFANKSWITNTHKKVRNPTSYPGVTNKYEGQLAPNHDFKHQTDNFIKIKTSLEQFGIHPTEIYTSNRWGKVIFVVLFNDPNIMWQKYEGELFGSGQNYMYWKSHRINTTLWIKYTHEQIQQILNGADPNTLNNLHVPNP